MKNLIAKMMSLGLLTACVMFLIGCGGGSKAPAKLANQGGTPSADSSPNAAAPADSKFACHLNCSGQEKHGYGATEDEARTDVKRFIETTCKPEDGQHFIVCNPTPE